MIIVLFDLLRGVEHVAQIIITGSMNDTVEQCDGVGVEVVLPDHTVCGQWASGAEGE
ncbi:hypothetical protein D3C73_1633670 [compost metagenome]